MPRKRAGHTRHRGKPKARVWVLIDGVQREKAKSFPPGTAPAKIEAWRESKRKEYFVQPDALPGTIGAMVDVYLPSVKAMPTYDQVEAHLTEWVDKLGRDTPVASITPVRLNTVMDEMARTPTNQPDPAVRGRRGRASAPQGQSKATIKKKRGTLRRMFNAINGKSGFNPVRDSKCPDVLPYTDPRGIPIADALAIIAHMPTTIRRRKGLPYEPTKAPLIAELMVTTGWPQEIIRQIGETDLVLDGAVPFVRLRPRLKGGGVGAKDLPVCAQAVVVLRRLAAAHLFGDFAGPSFNVAVKRAARKTKDAAGQPIKLPAHWHAYDLRHSFGAGLTRTPGMDEATRARLMLHAEKSVTGRRYGQAADDEKNVALVAAFGATFGTGLVPEPAQKPARSRKYQKTRRLRRAS